jgi:hypothetical protein
MHSALQRVLIIPRVSTKLRLSAVLVNSHESAKRVCICMLCALRPNVMPNTDLTTALYSPLCSGICYVTSCCWSQGSGNPSRSVGYLDNSQSISWDETWDRRTVVRTVRDFNSCTELIKSEPVKNTSRCFQIKQGKNFHSVYPVALHIY